MGGDSITISITLAQMIMSLSQYTVGIGEDDISPDELDIYNEIVSENVNRKNPGFTGNELVKFTAYEILDVIENKPGIGPRTQEKIKDNSYNIRPTAGSSFWIDAQSQMIADYLTSNSTGISLSASCEISGAIRDDADMSYYSDGSDIKDIVRESTTDDFYIDGV